MFKTCSNSIFHNKLYELIWSHLSAWGNFFPNLVPNLRSISHFQAFKYQCFISFSEIWPPDFCWMFATASRLTSVEVPQPIVNKQVSILIYKRSFNSCNFVCLSNFRFQLEFQVNQFKPQFHFQTTEEYFFNSCFVSLGYKTWYYIIKLAMFLILTITYNLYCHNYLRQ